MPSIKVKTVSIPQDLLDELNALPKRKGGIEIHLQPWQKKVMVEWYPRKKRSALAEIIGVSVCTFSRKYQELMEKKSTFPNIKIPKDILQKISVLPDKAHQGRLQWTPLHDSIILEYYGKVTTRSLAKILNKLEVSACNRSITDRYNKLIDKVK